MPTLSPDLYVDLPLYLVAMDEASLPNKRPLWRGTTPDVVQGYPEAPARSCTEFVDPYRGTFVRLCLSHAYPPAQCQLVAGIW